MIVDILASPITKSITLYKNYCLYSGNKEYMIVNYIYHLFLKSKLAASREENLNWHEAANGLFSK